MFNKNKLNEHGESKVYNEYYGMLKTLTGLAN